MEYKERLERIENEIKELKERPQSKYKLHLFVGDITEEQRTELNEIIQNKLQYYLLINKGEVMKEQTQEWIRMARNKE